MACSSGQKVAHSALWFVSHKTFTKLHACCIFGNATSSNLFAVVVLQDWHVSCLAGKAWIAQKCSTLHS